MAQHPAGPDSQALAGIRPGDPAEKLAAAVGDWWREPMPEEAGWINYLEEHLRFRARLARDGRVGQAEFHYNFDPDADFAGVRMLMPEDEVANVPGLRLSGALAGSPYRSGSLDLPGGGQLFVQVGHGRVTEMRASDPAAVYPAHVIPIARPTTTFDVKIVPGVLPRGADAPDGWCCGLPRGITPAQWPLSNMTGHPMEHHFTVRVPEPYRVRGPEFVALALFSDCSTESRTSDKVSKLMNIVFDGRDLPDTVEPDLQPFLEHLRSRHPMEARAKDILYSTFAMIWLTEEEFADKECLPPEPVRNAANAMCAAPIWEHETTSQRYAGQNGLEGDRWGLWRLELVEITNDPNTGLIPYDQFGTGENVDGYVQPYTEEWDALENDIRYSAMHFGGTARPSQVLPEIGPFYLEMEEYVGMMNFGGGNGQLDLVPMLLDWAQ